MTPTPAVDVLHVIEHGLSPADEARLLPRGPELVDLVNQLHDRVHAQGFNPVVARAAAWFDPRDTLNELVWASPAPAAPLGSFYERSLVRVLGGVRRQDEAGATEGAVGLIVGTVALARHWGGGRVGYRSPDFLVSEGGGLRTVLTLRLEPGQLHWNVARVLLLLFEAAGDLDVRISPWPTGAEGAARGAA